MTRRLRVAVQYGGSEYIIADRTLDDVLAEVARGVVSAEPVWLGATTGSGRTTPARLLLGPGVPIALWAINLSEPEAEDQGSAEATTS